jgi:excisionase family DNA binding protein
VSLSRKEIHRLVDALPEGDALTAKKFLEFLLVQSQTKPAAWAVRDDITPNEAARILNMSPKRLRVLLRERVIPATKAGSRWQIRGQDVRRLLTTEAQQFLQAPLETANLTEEEKLSSEEAWAEHLAGTSRPLDEVSRIYQHEPPKR